MLKDSFNRTVDYLRISITDRCDFRCVYCMSEDMTFLPRSQVLSASEILLIAKVFVDLGVTKIRVTGGEPLVRKDALWLLKELGALTGLEELVVTTNGSRLVKLAAPLRAAGVKRINISLDTLVPKRFKELTRTGDLHTVLAGIDAAVREGFERIKINTVVLRNRNDDEILALTAFALEKGIDLTFIEEMPLGVISEHQRAITHMPSAEIRKIIEARYPLYASTSSTGGPSRYYQLGQSDTRIGFISPLSHNFCDTCNRVRLTAEGRLLLCLGNEHSVDLRQIIRENQDSAVAVKKAIISSMSIKPRRHNFNLEENVQILRFMSMTGG